MASETDTRRNAPVKQLSVFVANRLGLLHDLTGLLKKGDVHVMAITVFDTTDSAIVRLIVDDPDKARDMMITHGFPYTESDIPAVEIASEADLTGILAALLEAEINVHYIYSFLKRPKAQAALAINLEDAEVGTQALNQRGYKVLTQLDISR